MSSFFGPSASWYDPPEPPFPCCDEAEDDPYHDVQACLDAGAEAWAEQQAEQLREELMEERYGRSDR